MYGFLMQLFSVAALLDRCFTALSMTDGDFLQEPSAHEAACVRQPGGGRTDNKTKAS